MQTEPVIEAWFASGEISSRAEPTSFGWNPGSGIERAVQVSSGIPIVNPGKEIFNHRVMRSGGRKIGILPRIGFHVVQDDVGTPVQGGVAPRVAKAAQLPTPVTDADPTIAVAVAAQAQVQLAEGLGRGRS